MPRLVNCRFRYSCPLMHSFALYGKYETELQEERPEVVVDRVAVEVVHHRRRRDQPRVGAAGGRVVAALGAQHTRLLLRLADVEHALVPVPLAQVLLRAVVLALAPTERHDVDAVVVSETLDGIDETLRDRRHQHRRRHAAAPDRAEEIRRARRPLQHRHVDVQVQPVDALERQRRVLRQDLGDGSCYLHGSGSGRWAPHRPVYGQRRHCATMDSDRYKVFNLVGVTVCNSIPRETHRGPARVRPSVPWSP